MRRLVYVVAATLDGFIATEDGDASFFPEDPATLRAFFERYPEMCPAHVRGALGVDAAPRRFDTVIMGRRTFQPALDAGLTGGAYQHLRQIVVTSRALPDDSVERWDGDVAAQVAALKDEPGDDIWLCGGGNLAAQLVDQIDEVEVKINPVLLGHGTPLLPLTGAPRTLRPVGIEEWPGGVTLARYAL